MMWKKNIKVPTHIGGEEVNPRDKTEAYVPSPEGSKGNMNHESMKHV